MMTQTYRVLELGRADEGARRIAWAASEMPVLGAIRERFAVERPLQGRRVSACLHVTTETANLVRTLVAGGATVRLCASNPLSTQDDVAAALAAEGVAVFAVRGESTDEYYADLDAALDHAGQGPELTLDDGADLVSRLHAVRSELLGEVIGGTEETTTGVMRLRAMAADGALKYPIVAVNDAMTKHLFDNRYGTGQSTIDGILRATNLLLAGRVVTVAGYGWCGRGIAMRARGMGAQVVVTEVDPLHALEAVMDGYRVMPIVEAAKVSDVMVTATGDKQVIGDACFEVMKDGCIVANSGHFDVEIDLVAAHARAVSRTQPRRDVEELTFVDGRRVRVLAQGRLVNLAAAEGHPSAVMDMSFADQALVVERLARRPGELAPAVHGVPVDIDQAVARMKLAALGVSIDTLTEAQARYLSSWREGT